MRKIIIFSLITLFILCNIQNNIIAEPIILKSDINNSWIVDNEGDGDFKSIICALANASNGDTIIVYATNAQSFMEQETEILERKKLRGLV